MSCVGSGTVASGLCFLWLLGKSSAGFSRIGRFSVDLLYKAAFPVADSCRRILVCLFAGTSSNICVANRLKWSSFCFITSELRLLRTKSHWIVASYFSMSSVWVPASSLLWSWARSSSVWTIACNRLFSWCNSRSFFTIFIVLSACYW